MAAAPSSSSSSRRSDTRVLIIASLAVVAAGLLIAAAILLVSSRGKTPALTKPVPFGVAKGLKQNVKDGGPVAFAGTTGDTGFWLALEHGRLVALKVKKPGPQDCNVRWRGSVDSFVDCHNHHVRIDQLARYPISVPTSGDNKGQLLVDLRHTIPPPNPA